MFLRAVRSMKHTFGQRYVQSTRSNRWQFHNCRAITSTAFNGEHHSHNRGPVQFLFAANVFSWLWKSKSDEDDEDSPENKLIMTIKRSILCIQREEYGKAEQMLHLALRMAQDLNSREGATYIFDVMANLAMQAGDFLKAEKLFVSVMQRILGDGGAEDDIRILHISSKLAQMNHFNGNLEKATQGFLWTLEKIEAKLKEMQPEEDLLELYGLVKSWYAQLLMQTNAFTEAKRYLLEAYEIYTNIHGKLNEEALMMLNNLGVVCTNLNEMLNAESYLNEAIKIVKELPGLACEGVLYANLGLLYIKQGLRQKAKETCSNAWRVGKSANSEEAIEQANYCLDQIKLIK